MDVPLKQTNTTLTKMMTTLKNTAKWELSSKAIHGIESAFSNALNYVQDLNQALTDIRVVSNSSVEDMTKFAAQANIAAKALGTTTKEYAKAALTYYQQGDSSELAAKKAEITLKATNVAFKATAQEMSEMLTSTWNGFQVGADELEHYVDVMANLGSHTASSVEEIATALQKVAATANTVGMSMEQVSAMIATVSSTTRQAASTVGTAMNTILSRFESLKLGETLEDGLDLTKYTKALKTIGVNVLDINGELRNMGDVVDEIMTKWQTLSDGQKTALANTVGGVRQYTNIMALFNNQQKYQENLAYAQNSDGSLEKMQSTYMTGIEAAKKKLQATKEGLWSDLIDEQTILNGTKALTGFVEQVQNLMTSLGGIKGVATTLGGILTTVFSKQIGASISNAITKIQTFNSSFTGIKGNNAFQTGLMRTTSLFTQNTNQRIYEQQNAELQSGLKDFRSGVSQDLGTSAQLESAQILLEKKQQLLAVENELNQTQKNAAQAAIANLQTEATQVEQVSQEYKQQQAAVSEAKKHLFDNSVLSRGDVQEQYESRRRAQEQMYNDLKSGTISQSAISGGAFGDLIANKANGLDQMVDRVDRLNQVSKVCTDSLSRLGDIDFSKVQQGSTELDRIKQELQDMQILFESLGADQAAAKMKSLLEGLNSSDLATFEATLTEVESSIAKLGSGSMASVGEIAKIFAQAFDLPEQELTEFLSCSDNAAEGAQKLIQKMREMAGLAGSTQFQSGGLTKGIQTFARGIGSAVMQFSTLSNLTANWDTSNLTSKITGIGMAFSNIMSNFGNWPAMIMSAVGAVAGILIGKLQQAEKEFQSWAEKRQQEVKDFHVLTDEDKQELQANQDLIDSYNELLATKAKGGSVDDQLIAQGLKLIDHFQLQGAYLDLLAGKYDLVAQKAREKALQDAKAIADSKIEEAYSKAQDYKGSAVWKGSQYQLHSPADNQYQDLGDTVRVAFSGGSSEYSSTLIQMNDRLGGKYTVGENQQIEITDPNHPLYGYGGLKAGKYVTGNQLVGSTVVNSYSEGIGAWTGQTIKIDKDMKDMPKLVQAITEGGLAPYLLESYIPDSGVSGALDITDLTLLDSAANDSQEYRERVYNALVATRDWIAGSKDDALMTSEFYSQIDSVIKEWAPFMEAEQTAFNEAKQAVDSVISTIASGYNSESLTWPEYKQAKQLIQEQYQEYDKKVPGYLDASYNGDYEAATNDYMSTNMPELAMHRRAEIAQNAILETIDPELQDKFLELSNAYIEKNGVRAASEAALSHLADHLDEIDYDWENDKELQALADNSTTTYASTTEDTFTEKLTKAKQALKQNLTGEEFISAMQNVLDWGENGIKSFNEFLQLSYDEQVAYLDKIDREAKAKAVKSTAEQLNAKMIAQKDANDRLQKFYETNNTDETKMTQAVGLMEGWSDRSVQIGKVQTALDKITSVSENGFLTNGALDENELNFIEPLREAYLSYLSNTAEADQLSMREWYDSLGEEAQNDYLEQQFDFSKLSFNGYTQEQIKEYQALKAGLIDQEDIDALKQTFNADLVAEFNARLLDTKNDMTELSNIISNGPSSVADWELLGRVIGEDFEALKDLSQEDLNKKIQTALSAPASYITPEQLQAEEWHYDNGKGLQYNGWNVNGETFLTDTAEQAQAAYLEAHPEVVVATKEQQAVLEHQRKKLKESVDTDVQAKEIEKDVANLQKYENQLSSLKDAYQEFVSTGQLSSKTKNALSQLGIDENSYKNANSLAQAIKNVRTELTTTRNNLKSSMGTISGFNGTLEDAQMTWAEFKETYGLQDDVLQSTFESWKQSFWDAKTAYDGWSEAAIEAEARITKSVNAQKLAQEQLTNNYNKLKSISDDVTTAFQNNEQISISTAKKLKEQGIIWQKGQEANLSNYGKVLGNTAVAQQQMLQGQKYNLSQAASTQGAFSYAITRNDTSKVQGAFDAAAYDLTKFMNEYDDIVPISEKLAGGDGVLAQKIQSMVKEAKDAGQSITWSDIFTKLQSENLDLDDQIAGIWDSFAQNGISAIESVLNEHQAAAEQIVNMWTTAFQAIAAAQTTFAKGLNLNQDTDEATLANQAALMLGVKNAENQQMFTYDQVATLIQGGNVTVGGQSYSAKDVMSLANQQLELPTGATWATSQGGATQFLYKTTTDATGKKTETRMTSGQQMIDNAKEILTQKWQDYIGKMDEEAAQAFKDAAKEKGLEGEITDETKDAWQEFAVEYLMNKYFGTDYASHADQIYQTAAGQEIAYGAYYSGQKQKNAETAAQAGYSNIYQNDLNNQIAETQKTQAAIDKALSLKLSGKNLGTNLSEDEQSRVLAATGAADIASVQLGDLSSASSNAAAALAQLASAAAALAEQTNKDNGFEKGADNRWYYRETKSSDQLSESDLASGQWTDNGDGTYSRLNYSEAVTTQMRTFDSAAQEALDTVNNFNTNLLSQYADALGETVDTIGSYCEAIAMANGITMDWNNLTQEQQLLMAEAAIRFNETADAIQSLNTLGKDNGVVEALLGTAKQSEIDSMTMQDYAQAYRDIVNAVNDLYGEGAVSAEFFNAATEAGKEHLELLTEIAEGGEKAAEAMEKLQRAVLDSFNTKNKLGFSSSELDDLSGINVKYGEQINDADLARINNLAQQHRLTAAQLKDLGNILGVTLDINQETRSAPTDLKGVQDAVQKIGKEARSTQKAADIAALIKADTKAFKGYNGEADEAKAKTQAIQDAWQQVADSGDIEQTAQAAADLAKTLNGVEGTEVKIEFNEDEIGSELANTLNSLPNVEAQIDYVANLPQIAPADVDADGTITYHTEGGDISFHTETKTATATNSSSGGGHVSVMGLSVPFSYSYSGTSTMSASVPVLDGASASGGTGNQASNSNNGGRGGGGGGGGGRRTKQLKDDHDRTRYHQMDRQLKKQNDLLTKNDKLKSRKYGSGYLDSLKAENKELKNQIDLNKEKIKEAQKYLEKDKKELEQNGATFDEDGNIDYDAYEKKWQDEYNRMVEKYNNGSMDDDEWTEFQRKYDNAMDAVERYEEAQDRIAEAQEEILEAQNQISANKLEMVTYELELKVELDQRQIDLLQTMLKLYENDLDKSSKLLTNYIEQMRLLQHQSNAAPEALANLMSQAGISSLDNIKQDKDGFIIPTVDGFDGDKMTVSDFAEGLKSIADQAQSSLDAIIEMRETMLSFYGDVIDKGEEKFSALANTMKHLNNMMSGYLELVDLYNTGGDVWDKKATIMEAQYDTQLQTIDMYEARMKLYQQQETELEAELQKDPTNEAAKRALEDLKETKEQAEEEWLDAVKTAAQTAKDLYQNSVDEIMDQMNKLNGDDMDWLKTKADLWKQNNDLYVDEVTKIYEVDKLTRKIEDSIADTRSKSNQAELKALKEKIKLQADSNELSEYDIEMMNKEYELLLAKQELENAKDAKNQVRLTRDENGNMIYQYTTDQDAVSEAEQKYNDVLYEMHKTSKEHLNDLYENLQETEEAYRAAVEQIWNDATLTAEEKQQRLDEVNEAYGKILDNLGSQIEITYGNLTDYDTRLSNRFAEELKGTAFDTDKYLNTTLVAMSKKADDFKQGMINCQTALVGALDSYSNRIDSLQEHTHTKWEDMTSDLGKFKTAATNTKNETDKLIETLKKSLEDAMTRIIKDFKNWNSEIEKTIKNLSSMIDKINAVLTALASLGDDRRNGGRRDGDDGRRDGDDGRRDGGRRDGDDGRTDADVMILFGSLFYSSSFLVVVAVMIVEAVVVLV